jgi:hypothetical protein
MDDAALDSALADSLNAAFGSSTPLSTAPIAPPEGAAPGRQRQITMEEIKKWTVI